MSIINTTVSTPKAIVEKLRASPGLPFQELLPTKTLDLILMDLEYRNRVYSPSVTIWSLLSQVLDDDQSLQATVTRLIASKIAANEPAPSANTSAYSQARSRLPIEVLQKLFMYTATSAVADIIPGWKWRDRHPKLMDGSTLSMPDTLENQETYPQPKSQKEGVGFPIARFVVIICYITGVVLNIAMAQYTGKETGEHALLREILDSFKAGDIALGDAYYPSYFLICELIRKGVDFVFPAHAARRYDFRSGEKLGKKDHVAVWERPGKPAWMEQSTYDNYPETMRVREVEIIGENKGFKPLKRILVTSFLDATDVTKSDLSDLYGFRWSVEVDLRSIKSVMKMDILRSKTPEMIEKEVFAHLLAYNLVRQVMIHAAIRHNKNPRCLSFKIALRLVEAFRRQGIMNSTNKTAYDALLAAIAHKEVGHRPGRQEPRAIKRRPKAQKRLQKPRSFYRNNILREVV